MNNRYSATPEAIYLLEGAFATSIALTCVDKAAVAAELVRRANAYDGLVDALRKISAGHIGDEHREELNEAIDTGNKTVFKTIMLKWSQNTAKSALADAEAGGGE